MSVYKKFNRSTLIGFIVFLIVGTAAFTVGIMMFSENQRFKSNANEIKGSISNIDEYKNDDGSTSHNVYVSFTLNGIEYEGKINEYNSNMYIGKDIVVFYNIDNPEDFRRCNPLVPMILISCGLLFLLIGMFPWAFELLKKASMKRFNQNYEWYANNNRYTRKNKMLADAVSALNKPNQPWSVSVEGNTITAYWQWKSAGAIKNKVNHYMFTVTLNDLGRWWEDMDKIVTTSDNIGEKSSFYGKTYQKSFEFTLNRDKQSGKLKFNKSASMDTAAIKREVRSYLTANGWKRAGLFWNCK